MGGRGSGGGKSGGGGGGAVKKEIPKTQLKSEIKEQPKEKTLQEKRLEALAKARAKRAENLKKGIKPEKKKVIPSDNKISEMIKKIAPDSRGWSWESNGREITVRFKESRKVKNSTWNKLLKELGEVGISDVMISND